MLSSGDTAAMSALPTDSCPGRIPFCTVQTSWDHVDESRTVIRGGHLGPDISPAGRVGYRKSYIAGDGPQCGFSSTLEGNWLSRDQQIAKLRLVAETAEEVWGAQ